MSDLFSSTKLKNCTVLFIFAILTAVILTGGCGGSGGGVQEAYNPYRHDSPDVEPYEPYPDSQDVEPYGPESYINRIAERLIERSTVYDLSSFV
ncbi:MAG: hypothetical protein IJU07_09585, partial [Synergistaceae bacterium]|nr:hypothetical protein [Synergistaceae bacterium]